MAVHQSDTFLKKQTTLAFLMHSHLQKFRKLIDSLGGDCGMLQFMDLICSDLNICQNLFYELP